MADGVPTARGLHACASVVIGPVGSGVTTRLRELVRDESAAVVCGGLETAPHPFAVFERIVEGPVPDAADAAEAAIREQLGSAVLAVDDAHLLTAEAIDLVSRIGHARRVVIGLHAGLGNADLVLARFAGCVQHRPEPVSGPHLRALVTTWTQGDDESVDGITAAADPSPALARAMVVGGVVEAARLDTYRRVLATLGDPERERLAELLVAPDHVRVAAGTAPTALVEGGLIDESTNRVRPERIAGLARDLYTPAELDAARRRLCARTDDALSRTLLLRDAGDLDAARAVAAAALPGATDPDLAATLATSAGDDRESLLHAARLLIERERPDEAAGVLRLVGDDVPVGLEAAIYRQLGHDARAASLPDLDPATLEAVRTVAWRDGVPAADDPALPDPASIADLDAARWRWHTRLAALAASPQWPDDLAIGSFASLVERPDVSLAWRQLGVHAVALWTFHTEGASRDVIAMLEQVARPGLPRAILDAHRAVAFADLGDSAAALALVDRSPQWSAAARTAWAWATAEAELAAGHPLAAIRAASSAVGAVDAWSPLIRLVHAWAAAEIGEPQPTAPAHAAAVLPWLARAAHDEAAAVALLAGGDHRAAADEFDELARRWADRHRRGALRCRWAAGESFRRAGMRDDAVDRLVAAEQECERLAHGPLLQRVRRSLRLAGVRRTGRRRAGTGPLSPREEEVITLVGKGLTTRDIAVRLGVSTATVETQIAAVMNKLGAKTRLQAAVTFREMSA